MKLYSTLISLIIIFIILNISKVNAQKVQNTLVDNFGVDVHLIGLGMNYEKVVQKDFSINLSANLQGGFYGNDTNFNYIFGTYISAEPRYYYNRNRRASKGKKLVENSGNFIAAELGYASDIIILSSEDNITINPTFLAGLKYGLRRNITKNLNYEFDFGIGYATSSGVNTIIPLLDFKLQYILF